MAQIHLKLVRKCVHAHLHLAITLSASAVWPKGLNRDASCTCEQSMHSLVAKLHTWKCCSWAFLEALKSAIREATDFPDLAPSNWNHRTCAIAAILLRIPELYQLTKVHHRYVEQEHVGCR